MSGIDQYHQSVSQISQTLNDASLVIFVQYHFAILMVNSFFIINLLISKVFLDVLSQEDSVFLFYDTIIHSRLIFVHAYLRTWLLSAPLVFIYFSERFSRVCLLGNVMGRVCENSFSFRNHLDLDPKRCVRICHIRAYCILLVRVGFLLVVPFKDCCTFGETHWTGFLTSNVLLH